MQARKLKVCIARFPYAGNGATSSEIPEICDWLTGVIPQIKADTRIESVIGMKFSDTPITMTRNRAVVEARRQKVDLLLMLDSDNVPDVNLDVDASAKPFWQSSFDFIYENWDRGPHVVFAPYCGPPPGPYGGCENVFCFKWANIESDFPSDAVSIEQYSREEAAVMAGIQPAAAGPTGCILFDMRAFELTEPKSADEEPWFYYEWTDIYQSAKASTEDVTALRDISLAGQEMYGYNPIFCNWDAWAGHMKPKCVGKPRLITTSDVSNKLRRAVLENMPRGEQLTWSGDKHVLQVPSRPVLSKTDHETNGELVPLL